MLASSDPSTAHSSAEAARWINAPFGHAAITPLDPNGQEPLGQSAGDGNLDLRGLLMGSDESSALLIRALLKRRLGEGDHDGPLRQCSIVRTRPCSKKPLPGCQIELFISSRLRPRWAPRG